MAQNQRAASSINTGGPHSVSLKVLRLSRPSLATQTPLTATSFGSGLDIPTDASLAHPAANPGSSFPLTPLLTLPSAFGAAYVGETFACTLCANNEITGKAWPRSISDVRIAADLQTPSNQGGIPLQLSGVVDADTSDELQPEGTIQRTVRHELKEEGPHVLAVTVTYTEITHEHGGGIIYRQPRTFRKLYQFSAQSLVAVRSKVTPMKKVSKDVERVWTLEAQLENVGEASVVIEKVWLRDDEGLKSQLIEGTREASIVLKPQDVEQVMFVVSEERDASKKGKRPLAQLSIEWRSAMGEKGTLTTGWLESKG